jgi:hypothetical protein
MTEGAFLLVEREFEEMLEERGSRDMLRRGGGLVGNFFRLQLTNSRSGWRGRLAGAVREVAEGINLAFWLSGFLGRG